MAEVKSVFFGVILTALAVGCASSSSHYYDSAINDRNRAPASLGIPTAYDAKSVHNAEPMHNRAQADFLFLKSEMESGAGHSTEAIELLKTALIYDADSATLMQKLAIEYYRMGNISNAVYWAEKAYEQDSKRRDLALLVAGLHTTNKNYAKAEEIYRGLVKVDKNDMEATLYLGAVYTETKNYKRAIDTFSSISKNKEYNGRHLAHYYLARVYAEQNSRKIKRIREELERCVAIKPDFFEAVSMLGQYIQKEEGLESAVLFYEKLQKDHGPQVKLAELLSQYYIAKGNYDKAYSQLEIIDEANEDGIQVKLKMALILIEKKIYDKAISKLEEILVVAPDSDKVRFYLSAVYEEKRDYKNALAQYLKIEKDSSYFEESRLHAAFIFKLQGQIDKSIELLKDLVPGKAENPQTFVFMAQLYEDKSDMKSSLVVLKSAEEKFADSTQVLYFLGVLQDKMNLKADMITSMKKVVELEPDHSQALNYLAYSWAEQGVHLEKAEAYARRAVAKEKDDPYILDTLGWVLYKKGDYLQALQVLERAHSMQSEVGIISEHLADVYVKLKMNQKAKEHLEKADKLEEDAEHKKELQDKIAQIEAAMKNERMPASIVNGEDKKESP